MSADKSGPAAVQALCQEGLALHNMGRLAEARQRYERALRLDPTNFNALYLLGAVFFQTGQPEMAVPLVTRAIAVAPNVPGPHGVLGAALQALGRHAEALAVFDQAIALQPGDAMAFYSRANALTALRRHDEALASYDRAVALKPHFAEAHYNRGSVLLALERFEDAVAGFDRAIALNPALAEPHFNRGSALTRLQRPQEALASFDAAIALNPRMAEAHRSRGLLLQEMKRCDDALASYDRAIQAQPDHAEAHFGRSLVLLAQGDLRQGFEAYRWRFRTPQHGSQAPDLPFPRWEGESLRDKSIVVDCEQGLGDCLQFIRYVKPLSAIAGRVSVIAPPPLVGLFRSISGVEVTAAHDGSAFDYRVALMCLPRLFGTTLETIPADVPYLATDAARIEAWRVRLLDFAGRPRVGLVWAGEVRTYDPAIYAVARRRNASLELLAPLANIPGVQFFSLQKGGAAGEAASPPPGMPLIDMTDDLHDFSDTAALVANLDLVITVDTSVAHLAGALGKPVWILSRFDDCWRWLNGREDSPWYPTARLFHQRVPGAWNEVVERVAAELERLRNTAAAGHRSGLAAPESEGRPG
jgi:tetratricopeptide (TPR) repeat protein